MRIVAELINTADGRIWSRTFDRELKDIFAVQAEIAEAVATSLELTLLGTEDTSAKKASTKSMKRTMPISRAIFTSSVAISKTTQGSRLLRSSDPLRF